MDAATHKTDHRLTWCFSLRDANIIRNKEWDPDSLIDGTFRALELGGEVGEALNIVKKLERERMGLKGSRATVEELADELADVQITLDLLAMHYGINMEKATARKFNKTSEDRGYKTRLAGEGEA